MDEQLNVLLLLAAVACAFCAIVSAIVCVAIWRRATDGDFGRRIEEGDKAVRDHTEAKLDEIREEVEETRNALANFISRANANGAHMLRARDLGPLHEKINKVAVDVAETRAATGAEIRALGEQNKVTQGLLRDLLSRSQS